MAQLLGISFARQYAPPPRICKQSLCQFITTLSSDFSGFQATSSQDVQELCIGIECCQPPPPPSFFKSTYLRSREREREVSNLLVHYANAYNSLEWARLKAGAGNSMQVSYIGGRGRVLDSHLLPPRAHISRKPEWGSNPGRRTWDAPPTAPRAHSQLSRHSFDCSRWASHQVGILGAGQGLGHHPAPPPLHRLGFFNPSSPLPPSSPSAAEGGRRACRELLRKGLPG